MPVSIWSRSGCWPRSRSSSPSPCWSGRWSGARALPRRTHRPAPPRRGDRAGNDRAVGPARGLDLRRRGPGRADSAGRLHPHRPWGPGHRRGRGGRVHPGRVYAATLRVRASQPGTLVQVTLLEVAGGRRFAGDTIRAMLPDRAGGRSRSPTRASGRAPPWPSRSSSPGSPRATVLVDDLQVEVAGRTRYDRDDDDRRARAGRPLALARHSLASLQRCANDDELVGGNGREAGGQPTREPGGRVEQPR